MSRKIILLSDGTGNSAAKVWRTNVWRVFESLDLSGSDQVAFYDDGVGTSSFKPLAIMGGAFGWGLKRNVLDLYKFLCRNYRSDDDEIFAFGFSRGAFTIRVVMGLVMDQGLVKFESEEELDRKIMAAYRAYRAEKFHSKLRLEAPFRWLWHRFVSASHDKTERPVKSIRFLGLWDTVAAYGLPVEEMTRGISRYLFPLELPDRKLDQRVTRACHALSLDDERTTFHPLLWDESGESVVPPDPATGKRCTSDEHISQVWFAGVHSNVGGGYPDDSLACVSLNWMMAEAIACGLRFKLAPNSDPDAIVHARSAQDKDGRLYDSRSGLGGYYRYGPRKLADLCNMILSSDRRDRVRINIPKIHESVFERTRVRAHLYAPIGLPERYEVVMSDGMIIPAVGHAYETTESAQARCKAQEAVWNLVWRRRAIYFLTVFSSLYLVSYPLYHKVSSTGEFVTPLRLVSDAIRFVGNFLPGAGPWLNAYAGEPSWFLLIAAIVGFLILVGSKLGVEISDRMNANWKAALGSGAAQALTDPQWPSGSKSLLRVTIVVLALYVIVYPHLPSISWFNSHPWLAEFGRSISYYGAQPVRGIAAVFLIVMLLPANWIYWLRSSWGYKKALSEIKLRIAPAFFALSFVYLGLAFASHLLFTTEDAFGLACAESPHPAEMRYCNPPTIAMCNDRQRPVCQDSRVIASCPAAASMAESAPVCGRGHVAMCNNIPAVCPRYCTDDVVTLTVPFDTRDVCFATKIMVERYGTYRLTVTPREDRWSALDGRIITNAGGFRITDLTSPAEKALMLLLWPLKRSFIRPWFAVVARVGSTGNDEDFLDPDEDFGSARKVVLQEKFKPQRDGELFLYVNNAVVAGALFKNYLRYFDYFYRQDTGTADIKIERLPN
jgi:uncharacterized protein (DUF2235 family)